MYVPISFEILFKYGTEKALQYILCMHMCYIILMHYSKKSGVSNIIIVTILSSSFFVMMLLFSCASRIFLVIVRCTMRWMWSRKLERQNREKAWITYTWYDDDDDGDKDDVQL